MGKARPLKIIENEIWRIERESQRSMKEMLEAEKNGLEVPFRAAGGLSLGDVQKLGLLIKTKKLVLGENLFQDDAGGDSGEDVDDEEILEALSNEIEDVPLLNAAVSLPRDKKAPKKAARERKKKKA